MDVAHYAAILVLFALWAALHVALCWAIAQVKPTQALVALVLPPLAPIWGQRFPRLASAWVATFVAYGLALVAGFL